jgi:hypothetical protein
LVCKFGQRKPAKGKGNADPKSQTTGQSVPAQEATQTSQIQHPDQASQVQQPTQNSQIQHPDQASQVQEPYQNSQGQDPTQASQIVNPTQVTAEGVDGTQTDDASVDASQGSAALNITQDLFDDLPDEVMATIPELTVDASLGSPNTMRTLKEKKEKMKRVSVLYHGKERRSSERVKQNAFKKPITGIGSTQEAPIVIKEAVADEMTHDDSKLGTCFRAMKSWKDIPKKKK